MKEWESLAYHWKDTSNVSVCFVPMSSMGQVIASDAVSSRQWEQLYRFRAALVSVSEWSHCWREEGKGR